VEGESYAESSSSGRKYFLIHAASETLLNIPQILNIKE
jgi:hypothetical protein